MSRIFPSGTLRPLILVAAIAMVGGLNTSCAKQKIQNVQDEAEANRIVDILSENGIKATKHEASEGENRYFEIDVDGGDEVMASAIQLMNDHCLAQSPPEKPEGSGVVTSGQVEKEQETRRRKLNIESLLREIPGVTCVKVIFVMPEDSSIAIDRYPSSAGVMITYKSPNFPISTDRVASMVAKSVPALKPENVQVELLQKPIRPLPDYKTGYNFARVGIISLLGFLTVLLTISIVFVLQKRRNTSLVKASGQFDRDNLPDSPLLQEDFDERAKA